MQFLKLCGYAILSTIAFACISSALSYATIFTFKLHDPLPRDQEWAIFQTALGLGILGYLGLYLLGLVMSWSRSKYLVGLSALGHALTAAFACSIIVVLEGLPRNSMEFLGFLVPVAVAVVSFYAVRLFVKSSVVA